MCVALNALRLYKELDQRGGVLRVDGQVVAFTIGEELCDDTFVVHIEKAFADIDGAYPMINQPVSYTHLDVYKRQNQVRATGIPKYFKNAPSIMESGGTSANRMMINSVSTNHVIWVKVTGNGRFTSLIDVYKRQFQVLSIV